MKSRESTIYFLADAHLRGPADPNQSVLVDFLSQHSGPSSGLVIMGDLFDYLAGHNRKAEEVYQPVLSCLEHWSPFHYIEGNHDFDLSSKIYGLGHAQLHSAVADLEFMGIRIQAAHGDRSDPHDWGTRILRRILQSQGLRIIRDSLLPHAPAFRFAMVFAQFSRSHTWPGRTHEYHWARRRALKALEDPQVAISLFAHTHQPLIEKTPQGVIANPGCATSGGSFLKLENDFLSLHRFPDGETLAGEPVSVATDCK